LPQSSELGFQFGFDGLENLGPDFLYLSAVRLADKVWQLKNYCNSRKILVLWLCHLNDCGIGRLGCV
jgi:hypothetical protein